jgi:hypothetical protein
VVIHEPRSTTIYSGDDAERAALAVPLQASFTGPYVLSSDIAATPCSDLVTASLLDRINEFLGTDRHLLPALETVLQYALDSCADFGLAYALLRPRWHLKPSEVMEDILRCQNADREHREAAIENDIVVDPFISPRRIWDLWSNRVVPIWMATPFEGERRKTWIAVSHSWMPPDLRTGVDTPINGHEWPVPIPTDTTLERIRVELLNYTSKLDVNLVWMDVLCLRQEGNEAKKSVRAEEWKLDVPTIGAVYPEAYRTVYYFSGLGRPFEAKNFDSPRHWQNRAWTLQETNANRIIGGVAAFSPSMPGIDNPDVPIDEAIRPFYENFDAWESFSHVADSTFAVVDAIRHRSAARELDKIAGLNYYLAKFSPLPAYILGQAPEDAWAHLIRATFSMQRADFFFYFDEPGDGRHIWCPSWQQVKDVPVLPHLRMIREDINLDDTNVYNIKGYCLENCYIEGLDTVSEGPGGLRAGKVILPPDSLGEEHTIPIVAQHTISIANGYYTLVGGRWAHRWVIGHTKEHGFFEKVSVIEIQGDDLNRKVRMVGKETVTQLL